LIGLILAVILFNLIAFKTNKTLSQKQIAHIWAFTIAFQLSFDLFIDLKYHAYWYFTKKIEWVGLIPHAFLVPPVNMLFLNYYPSHNSLGKQIKYFLYWEMGLLSYELMALLPKPWGYFHYGWWNLGFSAAVNPMLLIILTMYYKKFIK
jgi:hypothetical protein